MRREELIEGAAAGAGAAVVTVCAALALTWWLRLDPAGHLDLRLPVTPPGLAALSSPDPRQAAVTNLRGGHRAGAALPGPDAGSWPRFRGEDFDNTSRELVPLAESWPASGPPLLWGALFVLGGLLALRRGR